MGPDFTTHLRRSASRIAIIAATGLLMGCSGAGMFGSAASMSGPGDLVQPDSGDAVAGAAYWGARYDANRGDVDAAVAFARNLRMMGGVKQAVTLMKDVVMKAPDNPAVLAEYGKALAAADRAKDAIPFLSRASQLTSGDWKLLSAYGVALDQTGDYTAARQAYQSALEISPANPVIENNLAMSYVVAGQLAEGEAILRRLVARLDATPQMRQNLAMVIAIKGDQLEAARLSAQDLSAEDINNNLGVLGQFSAANARTQEEPETQTTDGPTPTALPTPQIGISPSLISGITIPAPVSTTEIKAPATTTAEAPAAAPAENAPQPVLPTATTRKAVSMKPIVEPGETPAAAILPPEPITPSATTATDTLGQQVSGVTLPALRKSFEEDLDPDTITVANVER